MNLVRITLLAAVGLLPCGGATDAGNGDRCLIVERSDFLSREESGGRANHIANQSHYEKVDHAGRRYYAILDQEHGATQLRVIECDRSGALRHEQFIADEKLHCATAVVSASVLPDGRLLALLHINPSTDAAVSLNCDTGQHTTRLGNTFTWNAAGQQVAYFVEHPRGENQHATTALWIDDRKIRDLAGDCSELAWDADEKGLTLTCARAGTADQTIHIAIPQK